MAYNPFNSQTPLIPTGSSKQRLLEAEYLRNADLAQQMRGKQAGSPLEAIVNALSGHVANKNALSAIEQSGREADMEKQRIQQERSRLLQSLTGQAPQAPQPQSSPIVDALAPSAPTGGKPDYRGIQAAIPEATGPLVGQGVPAKAPVPAPPMPSQMPTAQPDNKMATAMQLMELNDPISQAMGQAMLAEAMKKPEPIKPEIKIAGNQVLSIDPRTGSATPTYTIPPKPTVLDSGTKSTIRESEAKINAGEQSLAGIDKVIALTEKDMVTGPLAETRSYLGANIPDNMLPDFMFGTPEAATNTREAKNLILQQVLNSLKATFGAAPTEGERQILVEVQGSINESPEVLRRVLANAKAAAELRLQREKDYANELKTGNIYLPEVLNGEQAQ